MNGYSKRFIALACTVCVVAFLFCSGFTLTAVDPFKGRVPVYMNGGLVVTGSMIDDTTYVPVRAFCESLMDDASVSWDQASGTVTVSSSGLAIEAQVGECYITANERPLYAEDGVLNVSGTVMVPIRTIAKAFGVGINWDEHTDSIDLDGSEMAIIQSAEDAYDEDDLYWLSRLIYSESGNQPLEGMIAVGNVVLNRVESERFPDTIYGVISQSGQFDVFSSGAIYSTPNELSVIAAMLCLDGVEVIEEGLFFVNPSYGGDSWFRANLTYIASIEDHDFYA